MDASELHTQRPNAKDVLTSMNGENFIFPVADGTVKIFWRRWTSETIHLNPGSLRQKNKIIFQENQTGLHQHLFKTHHGMMVKPKVIFCLSQEISLTVTSCGTPSQTVRADGRIIPFSNEIYRRNQNR